MPRMIDVVLALAALIVFAIPMALVAIAVKLTSPGPVLYWSQRVGRYNCLFAMPKFRSMRIDTPALPTHLLRDGESWLTPIGGFLRRSSLDELPQLWCILTGDMAVVGPRPALFNQDDLVAARTAQKVHELRPGLTGWAQVNGRDNLSIPEKVDYDAEYLRRRSFGFDMIIIWKTIKKVLGSSDISH
ncbi:MAG: sugar transferase [Sphingomonas sp.]|nr:sugar transferase [Sphingomonas sp.]